MTQSNEPTIDQQNEVIALFMGGKPVQHNRRYRYITWPNWHATPVQELNYHKDWSRLMPVVEKIESIHDDFHGYFGVHINSNGCTIQGTKFNTNPGKEHYAYFNDVTHETKILATHYMVYQFIQWLNQQKQKDEQT